jgi:hypothetical protein
MLSIGRLASKDDLASHHPIAEPLPRRLSSTGAPLSSYVLRQMDRSKSTTCTNSLHGELPLAPSVARAPAATTAIARDKGDNLDKCGRARRLFRFPSHPVRSVARGHEQKLLKQWNNKMSLNKFGTPYALFMSSAFEGIGGDYFESQEIPRVWTG